MSRSLLLVTLFATLGLACTEQLLPIGQSCSQDADCDPGDSCSQGTCASDLRVSAFSVTPAAATASTTVGQAPRAVSYALVDSTKTGHPFDVACSGGAVPTPASGSVKSGKDASISLQAPAPTAVGTTHYTCTVTSTKAHSAQDSFTLAVKATAPKDFALTASPASLSLAQGDSGTVQITLGGSGGFWSAVTLTVSGAPAGSTASVSPTSVWPGSAATLTVQAGTAAAGTHALTIVGTSGALSRSLIVPLTIAPSGVPEFSLSISPASVSTTPNGSVSASVQVSGSQGFAGPVALSAQGLPAGVTAAFTPTSVVPGGVAELKLTASSAAAVGDSSVIIVGSGGGLQRTAALALSVQGGNTGGGPVGPAGGTVDLLDFVMTGDTRPSTCGQNAGYPVALHAQIVQSMGRMKPQFGLDLGDHMYVCGQNLAEAQQQMGYYVQGLQGFPAYFAMTMGNHECEGGQDCSANPNDVNYSTYLAALRQVSKQTSPNYALQIQTRLGRATIVVVADNSFGAADRTWLESTLSEADRNSKYTIIAKHHPVTGSRTGPPAPWQVMQNHKYSLVLQAHDHDYAHNTTAFAGRTVVCGLGGANPSHTGFCRVQQAADGSLQFTQYDVNANPGDTWSVPPQ